MTPCLLSAAMRALPRVATLTLAVAALVCGRPVLVGIAVVVLLAQLTKDWRGWAHYVRTGARPAPVAPEQFAEPGPHSGEIAAAGERRIDVIKAVREVTGAPLLPAQETVDGAPSTVCSGVSSASASRVASRLRAAGAEVKVSPPVGD